MSANCPEVNSREVAAVAADNDHDSIGDEYLSIIVNWRQPRPSVHDQFIPQCQLVRGDGGPACDVDVEQQQVAVFTAEDSDPGGPDGVPSDETTVSEFGSR
jgi:hypothetical protein